MPRLTALLRAQTRTAETALLDLSAAYLQRQQILNMRSKQLQPKGDASGLLQVLAGDQTKIPKDLQREHEKLMSLVSKLAGGQLTAAELAEAVMAVWAAVEGVPGKEEAFDQRASLTKLQRPARCCQSLHEFWVPAARNCASVTSQTGSAKGFVFYVSFMTQLRQT